MKVLIADGDEATESKENAPRALRSLFIQHLSTATHATGEIAG